MEWISDANIWLALVTLTFLEIVLGIDNVVFISILTDALPDYRQNKARLVGLALAMFTRVALLFSLTWMMRLTDPIFSVYSIEISWRDVILILGGIFLIGKSVHEIHDKLEGLEHRTVKKQSSSFAGVVTQIVILDIVFSLDSVITAIGMASQLAVMVAAVILGVGFMMLFAGAIGEFIEKHPTMKMLALSFLVLIGVSLVADALDQHIPKGYIYFAMAFSIGVEALNLRSRKRRSTPVRLKKQPKPRKA
jgi:predicted tellurium resistance membrane protein TerC